MKNLIYKKLNILEIVLILSPIIDILTSVSQRTLNIDISLGLIIRSFLLFFMTAFTLVESNYKYKKVTIGYLLLVSIYSILFCGSMYLNKGNQFIISEIKNLIKAFYFPICLVAILNYVETRKYKINLKLIFFVMLEYLVLLFIPSILNLGYESYAEDKIGTIGWFFSANEISSIYSILIVLVVFSYKYIKNKIIYFGLIIISFYTVLQIGTKMPAISTLIVVFVFIIFYLIKYINLKEKKYIKDLYVGIGIFSIFVIIFMTSPVLKNFDIYKNYLISTREKQEVNELNLDSINEKAEENINDVNIVINEDNKNEYKDNNLTSDEIATIIHSGRLETVNRVNYKFKNSNFYNKLIGLGRIDIENNDEFLTEIDYIDILFNYGIVGFIIYFIPAIIMGIIIIKKIFKSKIKLLLCDDYKVCYVIIILNGLICAIAGHTLVAPAVSIYISIILVQFYRDYK